MKRPPALFAAVLAAASLAATAAPAQARKGPIVDRVYFDVRMDQSVGLRDAAEARTDVFWYAVTGPTFGALPADMKARLDVYSIPSTTWSLLMNPIPDRPPYTWTAGGRTQLNPFAIREVRFAMSSLISRKRIVDEILGGMGSAMFTMATPGQPGTYRYNLVASRMGLQAAGNERRAIEEITAAMTKASELPELKGRLRKGRQFWELDREPVTVKLVMRVDDPSRVREGRYVADQIEKAGIKVDRLELDRARASALVYAGNPADYAWQMYTEGWGAGATRAWWDNIVRQMYAPSGGALPGGGNPAFWNYKQAEIDDLTERAQTGQFLNADEYWQLALKAAELGLREAVRIYVCSSQSYQVANRDRMTGRMAYGLGDGLNDWSLRTADVKPEKDGTKILRVTQFSARGSLFMNAWDPIGVDGFEDLYSNAIANACYDPASFEAPSSARDTPMRVAWSDVQTRVRRARGADGREALVGDIPVPESAVLYDSASKSFRPAGRGRTAFSRATYSFKWGAWHTGRPITIADVMYAQSFIVDWITKDGPADRQYDAQYESSLRPIQEKLRGIVLNPDGTVTTYFDFNHPDRDRVGSAGAIWVTTYGSAHQVGVSWEIAEALGKLVAEGGKSGKPWSFSADPAFVEVDVLRPDCLADLRAKLQQMADEKYVPAQIRQWKSADEAVQDYRAAIRFIDEHRNAYISNGPFSINSVDTGSSFVELRAFRDERYPFAASEWIAQLASRTTRIDGLDVPAIAARDKDAAIGIRVSVVDYPSGAARGAEGNVKVKATVVPASAAGGEKTYGGSFARTGEFSLLIPAADVRALGVGSHTLVIETSLADEAPATEVAALVVF